MNNLSIKLKINVSFQKDEGFEELDYSYQMIVKQPNKTKTKL